MACLNLIIPLFLYVLGYYGTKLKYVAVQINTTLNTRFLAYVNGIPVMEHWEEFTKQQVMAERDGKFWVIEKYIKNTVQTFNSCTRRPDVCQRLLVQTPINNMSKNKPSTSHHCLDGCKFSCEVRDLLSHPCPGNLVAIRCAVVCYARLPMHLVQEFNAGTVCEEGL